MESITLKQQALEAIDAGFKKFDEFLPEGSTHVHNIQEGLDMIGNSIEFILEPLSDIDEFISSNSAKNLVEKLIIELAKLPLKAARNILATLYAVVREIVMAPVHPMEAAKRVAKALVELIDALANPTTWTTVGTGMISGALGQALITGQVVAPIMIIIGSALIAAGLTGEAIRAYINAETTDDMFGYIANELFKTIKMLPEVAATGLAIGAIIGAFQPAQPTQQQIDALGRKFVRDYRWAFGPDHWQSYQLDSSGAVVVMKHYGYHWNPVNAYNVVPTNSSMLAPGRYVLPVPSSVPVILLPKQDKPPAYTPA